MILGMCVVVVFMANLSICFSHLLTVIMLSRSTVIAARQFSTSMVRRGGWQQESVPGSVSF